MTLRLDPWRSIHGSLSFVLCFVAACSSSLHANREENELFQPIESFIQSKYQCENPEQAPVASETLRLTKTEYRNTLTSLFGEEIFDEPSVSMAYGLIPSDYAEGNRIPKGTQEVHIDNYLEVGLGIGEILVGDQDLRTSRVASCATSFPLSTSCLGDLVQRFGKKVFRKALSNAEVSELTDTYNQYAGTDEEKFGILIGYMLTHPSFLYHLELEGTDIDSQQGIYKISPYALAGRLSYALWGTMPDDQLMEKAANGDLERQEGLTEEVQRLLSDSRARTHLSQFYGDWLKYKEIPDFAFPQEIAGTLDQNNLKASMIQELEDYVNFITWEETGGFYELMTSEKTFIPDEKIASIYGTTETGEYAVDTSRRLGLLSKPGVLARLETNTYSRPIYRGVWTLKNVLCSPPALPAGADIPENALSPIIDNDVETTRQKVTEATAAPVCMGCHETINHVGFAMEKFDGFGRFQEEETIYDSETLAALHNLPIDSSTDFTLFGDSFQTESGVDFIQQIARMHEGYDCMSQKWLEYIKKREIEEPDHCSLSRMVAQLAGESDFGDGTIQMMILESLIRPEIRLRRVRSM